ncbi:DUF4738 domain-containing protein [Bacteroides sp. 214]|uniref:DUF4738 domain-containing protein n=1 Tax=Bacteroides sp. 214 TaxID=2302935 RepID=UPI0013D16F70|nr:DUF4738 domain-containing protein [Bacteroides sp. 214]NDW13261.1 DUF4738 domain-containing protein [Bacteroides sp. 214]
MIKCFLLCVYLLLVGCNKPKNVFVHNDPLKEVMAKKQEIKDEQIIIEKDTLVEKFHLYYKFINLDDSAIKKKGTLYNDEEVLLEYSNRMIKIRLEFEGKLIFSKTIRKEDFSSIIPPKEIQRYQLWNFDVENATDENIIFSFNVCIPDTDDCYSILYIVDRTGDTEMHEEIVEWED